MRRFISFLFIVILSVISCNDDKDFVAAGKKSGRDLDEIIASGKIRAVTNINQTSYFIYRGEPMGFHFELLKRFADRLDLELELVTNNDIDEAMLMLQNGDVDVVAMGLTVNSERKEMIRFTDPVMQTRQVLVQRKPNGWTKMNAVELESKLLRDQYSFANKTIYTQKGSCYAQRLYNIETETGEDIDIVEVPYDAEELARQVAAGVIDYTVCDENIASVIASMYASLDVQTPVSFSQNLAWGIRKDNSDKLADELSSWITGFRTTREYASLESKYFTGKRHARMAASEYLATATGKVSPYDEIIRHYSDSIGWDWRLVASLIYQESGFNPSVESSRGAYGLMQVMPSTGEHFGLDVTASVEDNVYAGVRYISWLNGFFYNRVPDPDERVKFILASYNAGQGHILDAINLARKNGYDTTKWDNNVALFLARKADPDFYRDPMVKFGSLQGAAVNRYVDDILERYSHYQNIK